MVLLNTVLLAALPAVLAQVPIQPFANNTEENLVNAQSPPKYPSPVSLQRRTQHSTRTRRVNGYHTNDEYSGLKVLAIGQKHMRRQQHLSPD